jgi:hypothetical protein
MSHGSRFRIGFPYLASVATFCTYPDQTPATAICTNWCSGYYARGMKRATITLPDDLEQALERFVDERAVPVQLTAVVQAAVREYLGERGYLPSVSTLRIRPAKQGSGRDDISVSRDAYLSST